MQHCKAIFTFLFTIILLIPFTSNAQQVLKKGKQSAVKFQQNIPDISFIGDQQTKTANPALPYAFNRSVLEEYIGQTRYDLQTNHTIMNRLTNYGDGELSAVWTMGFADASFPDRGTGYSHYDGSSWESFPSARLEDVRTGWPSIIATESATELVVAHDFAVHNLVTLRREAGSTDWVQSVIPTNTPFGTVWPQMAAGGGENVHVISISSTVAIGGDLYEGVDGHILYNRSQDGGQTWDIVDAIIPGLDSTTYDQARRADTYKVAANGNVIAVAVFSWWEDVRVFKSEDNGDTWTQHIAYDFPFEKYAYDTGYTYDDIPNDPNSPDSLAIFTGGNSGSVLVDNNGQVHLFFGSMYVVDDNLTDNNFSFFPCSSGISYWNESFGSDSTRIIADVVDANANDSLDLDCVNFSFGAYVNSLTSFPTVGLDDDNNIFLSYSAVTEDFMNENAMPGPQNYRHIYAIASLDNGETWTVPYDVINEDNLDPILADIVEAVYPAVALKVDNQMHLIYQQDMEPGTNFGEGDSFTDNFISYIGLPISIFGLVPTVEQNTLSNKITLSPNPASSVCYLDIDSKKKEPAQLLLYDLWGKRVYEQSTNINEGSNRIALPIADLPPGMYLVNLVTEENMQSVKILVQ